MVSVVCLVATQQEGYLYYFNVHGKQDPARLQQAACVTVYPFTAPVTAVAMESYVLHALTEIGLETYTLRTGCQFVSAVDLMKNTTGVSILCVWMSDVPFQVQFCGLFHLQWVPKLTFCVGCQFVAILMYCS
jgi:hypothetical protein